MISSLKQDNQVYIIFGFVALASVLTAFVGVFVDFAMNSDPTISPLAVSFCRVVLHPIAVGWPLALPRGSKLRNAYLGHDGHRPDRADGRLNTTLWLAVWGASGAATVALYFASIKYLGSGLANVFSAASGLGVVFLAPLVGLGTFRGSFIAAGVTALYGTYLIKSSQVASNEFPLYLGLSLAGSSSLAWLAVAKVGKKATIIQLAAWWTVASLIVHLIMIRSGEFHWPATSFAWSMVVSAGLFTAVSQICTALAMRIGNASLASILGYLAPILAMIVDAVFWQKRPASSAVFGVMLILMASIYVTFSQLTHQFNHQSKIKP
jgi:drug/metabolite transporter (DMT)-like permease